VFWYLHEWSRRPHDAIANLLLSNFFDHLPYGRTEFKALFAFLNVGMDFGVVTDNGIAVFQLGGSSYFCTDKDTLIFRSIARFKSLM